MASIPVPSQLPLFPLDKRCSKCGTSKPRDAFGKNSKSRDGRQSWCKACCAANKRAVRAADPEKEREAKRRYLSQPHKRDAHYARARQWHTEHREEVLAAKRADRRANPEKYRAQGRQKRERHLDACKARDRAYYAAHREERNAYGRMWREQNRARASEASRHYYHEHWAEQRAVQAAYYEAHQDEIKERMRTWASKNLPKLKILIHRRRARLAEVGGTWVQSEWEAVKAKYEYRCLRCGQQEPVIKLVFDHVIPISLGGRNDIANCQPLCGPCNSTKRQRTTDYR